MPTETKWHAEAKRHGIDLAFGAAGVAFGWESLTFPFGRDQGLYFYVGRGWLHGAMPYRDLLDQKTPGIYVLNAIAIALFGENMWGVRVLDLLVVVLTGIVAASFTAAPGERPLRGVRGGCIAMTSLLYFGYFNFWDTAQCELGYSMLGLASIWAARSAAVRSRAEVTAGLLASLAVIMKPPAVWLGFAAFVVCLSRVRWREEGGRARAAITTVRFTASFLLPLLLLILYFGVHHALWAMADVVIGANRYYVTHESSIHSLRDVWEATLTYYRIYNPLGSVLLVGGLVATFIHHRSNDRDLRNRYLFCFLLCALGFAAVLMQKKFYTYHWGVVIGPAVALTGCLAADISRSLPAAHERRTVGISAVALVLFLWRASDGGYQNWYVENDAALSWLSGRIDREAFTRHFDLPWLDYRYHDDERVGLWLRAHSKPSDLVAVRGFEPAIYAVAQRECPGRFFWTTFLTSPVRAYRREEWLAEDDAAFARTPPRYIVCLAGQHEGVDAAETYYARGYVLRERIDDLQILERAPVPSLALQPQ